jgi:hypothetical protein
VPNASSPYRSRFLALYAALGAVVCLAALGAFAADRATPPAPAPQKHCWVKGPSLGVALYGAANCRFGTQNVGWLGWMPYLGATEAQRLEEVAVVRPDGGMSFWIAAWGTASRAIVVKHWVPCAESNEYC